MFEEIRDRARIDLIARPKGHAADTIVWEHAERVLYLTQVIARLPELAKHVVDRPALTAAALYHDAAWLLQCRAGQIQPVELLLKRATDRLRDQSADWMAERLKGLLPPATLQQAARIIRTAPQREPALLEARILGEADNLDQIGPQAVILLFRRQIHEGKTLADLIQAWRRQEQYQFWPAWIRECFHYPSTKALAEQRWQSMRRYMADLEMACHTGQPTTGRPAAEPTGKLSHPSVDPTAAG